MNIQNIKKSLVNLEKSREYSERAFKKWEYWDARSNGILGKIAEEIGPNKKVMIGNTLLETTENNEVVIHEIDYVKK